MAFSRIADNIYSVPYVDFSEPTPLQYAVSNGSAFHIPHGNIDTSPFHSPTLQQAQLHAPYPMLQNMQPPQLHQPTVDVKKEQKKAQAESKPKPKVVRSRLPQNGQTPERLVRPPNAFLLFNKEMRKKLKDKNPTAKVAEISKEVGERWRNLTPEEKSSYQLQASQLKANMRAVHPHMMYIRRTKEELAHAGVQTKTTRRGDIPMSDADHLLHGEVDPRLLSLGVSNDPAPRQNRKRRTREKNPAAPKHPLSAYMWYLTEVRPATMQEYPGSTVGQISKIIALRWRQMDENERAPWLLKARDDKLRYTREMQVYAAKCSPNLGRGTRNKYRTTDAELAALNKATIKEHHRIDTNADSLLQTSLDPTSLLAGPFADDTSLQSSPIDNDTDQYVNAE
ncbi:high mobility group box domain-containing protein [Umbelopsis sp. AD052]|nr:high mobility group box domain-containing protein [Umbelopsis sp. AD052]